MPAKIIKSKSIDPDLTYEPPLVIGFGVSDKTTGSHQLTMGHTIIPPRGKNPRHFHAACDAAFFIIKGKLKLYFGPDHNIQTAYAEAGDFVWMSQGEIHGLENESDTETAELVFTYPGVGNKEEAITVFVEPKEEPKES